MLERIDRRSLINGFDSWLGREHARLHGPGNSVMSDLDGARRASALDIANMNNHSYWKTSQHLDRFRLRVGALEDAEFGSEMVGKAISDGLKLVAGMQVKRLVATSLDQDDFADKLRHSDMSVADAVIATGDRLFAPPTNDIMHEVEILRTTTIATLQAINARAQEGNDWGVEDSPMTQAAHVGELASLHTAIVVINYVAPHVGGFELVPLKTPSSDTDRVQLEYPFRSE